MSENTILGQVHIVRGTRVHATERDLTTTTDGGQMLYKTRTLCRPDERIDSWRREGVQVSGPVTCANCKRIIAKAEAEAYAEQSATTPAGRAAAYGKAHHLSAAQVAEMAAMMEAAETPEAPAAKPVSDLIITKAPNIIHFGRVHAAERDLKVWYGTTDYTAASQRPLCRPSQALGRYGVQITKASVTCANCLRIIAKAEAEARTIQADITAGEKLETMWRDETPEAPAAKPVKLNAERDEAAGPEVWMAHSWRTRAGRPGPLHVVRDGVPTLAVCGVELSSHRRAVELDTQDKDLYDSTCARCRAMARSDSALAARAAAPARTNDVYATVIGARREADHAEALVIDYWLTTLAAYSWVPRSAVLRITTNSQPDQVPSIADNLRASGSMSDHDARREAAHAEALDIDRTRRIIHVGTFRTSCFDAGCRGCTSGPSIERAHAEALELNAAQRPGSITETYSVTWREIDGSQVHASTVALTEGYTTWADIPAIIATTYFASPSRADRVRILTVQLVQS